MKLAFILLSFDMETVHGSERLLHWLYHPDHTFVFHIDSGASELYSCYLKRKYGERPPPCVPSLCFFFFCRC